MRYTEKDFQYFLENLIQMALQEHNKIGIQREEFKNSFQLLEFPKQTNWEEQTTKKKLLSCLIQNRRMVR